MASSSEKSMELRERLQNGSLTLRDLDNRKRGSLKHKGKRRRRKPKTGKDSAIIDAQTLVKPQRSRMPNNTDIGRNDLEMIARGIIDDIFDGAYNQCAVIKYSIAREKTNELADVYLKNFIVDERVRITRRENTEQRERTLELLYKAAEENVDDLILRATMPSHQSINSVSGTDQILGEMTSQDEDSFLPKRGWKWLMCGSRVSRPYQIARGIIDDIFDGAYNQCAVIEYSIAREKANESADVYLKNFIVDERVRITRRENTEQRERTLELLYKAAEEIVDDLILRATMPSHQSIDGMSGTDQILGEMTSQDEDSFLPKRGWKWLLCGSCVSRPYQQKKKKSGFLARLYRLFRRQ